MADDDAKKKKNFEVCLASGMNPNTNPTFAKKVHLNCKNRCLNLAIYPDGTVKGTEDRSPYTKLELISVGQAGIIKIKGLQSKLFLAVDQAGAVMALENGDDQRTKFRQGVCGSYRTYMSMAIKLLLAIKKNGQVVNKEKAKEAHHSVQYLSVPVKE